MLSRSAIRRPPAPPRGGRRVPFPITGPASGLTSTQVRVPRKRGRKQRGTLALVKRSMLMEQQIKFQDTVSGTTPIDQTGTLFLLNGIPQFNASSGGAPDPVTRLADRVVNDKLYLRLNCSAGPTLTGDAYNTVRVIVFWWANNRLQAAGTPASSDVLEYTGIVDAPNSPYKYETTLGQSGARAQVSVILDETFALSAAGPSNLSASYLLDLNGRAVQYAGVPPAGGQVNIEGDALFLLAISDSLSPPDPNICFVARLTFRDAQ